jgi:DNA polymerase-3 subunit delta'
MTEQDTQEFPAPVGHARQEAYLAGLAAQNRLPHALLLAGPQGIGKSLFALRLAAFLLSKGSASGIQHSAGLLDLLPPEPKAAKAPDSLAVPPQSPIARRILAGSHPDFLLIRPEFDEKKKEYKAEIPVETVRRIGEFMALTPSESDWRVAVIDSVDQLNRNAANAVLKVLEEPPAKAVLVLVSHNPGRLLPTIRSRCQLVGFAPLPEAAFLQVMAGRGVAAEEAHALASLSGHAPGRGFALQEGGGIALYAALLEWLANGAPQAGVGALMDALLKKDGEQSWQQLGWILDTLLMRVQKTALGLTPEGEIAPGEAAALMRIGKARAASGWVRLWERAASQWADASQFYLDKRLVLQQFLYEIATPEARAA